MQKKNISIKKENKNLNEDASVIIAGSILMTIIFIIFECVYTIVSHYRFIKKLTNEIKKDKNTKLDKTHTKMLRTLIGDETIEVIEVNIPGSKESNAFNLATPHLFYTSDLKKELKNERELIAILLHEYGHYKLRHVHKMVIGGVLLGTTFRMALLTLSTLFFMGSGVYNPSMISVGNILAMVIPNDVARKILDYMYSHSQEFKSDEFAKKYGYEKDLIKVFKRWDAKMKQKMCKNIKDKMSCEKAIRNMHKYTSHPAMGERIEKLSKKIITKFMKVNNDKMEPLEYMKKWNHTKSYIQTKYKDLKSFGISLI